MDQNSRFTVAAIPSLASQLTDVQRQLIDRLWDEYISLAAPYLRRSLLKLLNLQSKRTMSIDSLIAGLNGSLLVETTSSSNDRAVKLNIYGALLTTKGTHLADLLIKLLDNVRRLYEEQSDLQSIDNLALKNRSDLSAADLKLLCRLLSLDFPFGMPFHLSGYNVDGSQWQITINDHIEDLHFANSSEDFLNSLLSNGFANKFDQIASPRDLSKKEKPNDSHEPSSTTSTITSALSALSATRTEAEAVSDLLGREKLTQALYRLLTEREDVHPFAIGLFGQWGAGKSSQIEFLRQELERVDSPKVLVAKFNAWQNEKATNLAAMMAQCVVDGLTANEGLGRKLSLALQLAVSRHSPTIQNVKQGWKSFIAWLLTLAWVLSPYAILLLLLALILYWMPPFVSWKHAWTLKVTSETFAVMFSSYHFMRSHLTDWFKRLDPNKSLSLFSLPDYSAHRGLILEIHRTLQNLCALCLKGSSPKDGTYLLLVIDDLDRCSAEAVKSVLDAVRIVANIPRIVTLLAIDERIAFAAVEKHYDHFDDRSGRPVDLLARDYLAKIFQVSVILPEVDHARISSYVDNKIFSDIDQGADNGLDLKQEQKNSLLQNFIDTSYNVEVSLTDEQTAPTQIDQQPQQSSLPEERIVFKELAQIYEFSNPRMLWRLYMAWKLLKSLYLGPLYTLADVEVLMHILFWREWLHQIPPEKKNEYTAWIQSSSAQQSPALIPNAIFDSVKLKLRPNWKQYSSQVRIVDSVLLPSKPTWDQP
jgi:KAP family P-loop domain